MIYKTAQIETYFRKPEGAVKGFLLYGSNEGLIAEYTKKLVQTVSKDLYDPFSVVYLDWENVKSDIGLLISEYNSQSLMSSRRVVVLRDADNNLTKDLSELLENSKTDTLLVVCGSENLNGRSSLVTLFNSATNLAAVACYDDRDESVASSVKTMLAEQKITYTQDAFMLLCSRLSNDRKFNANEIEKLITYVGTKKHFEADDVRAVVFDQAVSGVDDLCFYVFSGLKQKSLNSLRHLLNEGVEEVQIIRGLSRHVSKLLDGKALMESGETASNAIKKILPKNLFYRYDMGANQLSRWPKDRLFDVMGLLYKTERDCKTTNIPVEDVLGYTVLTLVSAAGRLAAVRQ